MPGPERIVEVERIVERVVEKIVEVPGPERIVEVERLIEVPVERIVEIPAPERVVEVERIVEKLVEVPVDREVIKEVRVPGPERIVEVERLVEKEVEKIVVKEVEKIVYVDRLIQENTERVGADVSTSQLMQLEPIVTRHAPTQVRAECTIVTKSRMSPQMVPKTIWVPSNEVTQDPFYSRNRYQPSTNTLELHSQDFHRQADDIYQSMSNVKIGEYPSHPPPCVVLHIELF